MTTAQEPTEQAAEERPRLLAVEIGDWPGLGGNVRLDLSGWRTVLVGKNGAGKSLLIEGVSRAARQSWFPSRFVGSVSRRFRCDIALSDEAAVAYEYRVIADDTEEEIDSPAAEGLPRVPSWTERCWRLPDGEELWRVADAQLTVGSSSGVVFPPGMGLLAIEKPPVQTPGEVGIIRRLLAGFGVVEAGVPRGSARRREILVGAVPDAQGVRRWRTGIAPIDALARAIVVLFESNRETFNEFAAILRQLGLAGEVSVKIYEDPQADQNESKRRDYALVLFDGVNIGLLSDGTQRIAQIVRLLLQEKNTCLLIEEPETAVHPGLLSKLLALLDSYGYDRQIVVSTHSPQVVDWCKPEELRLVERSGGKTAVRSLSAEDLAAVKRYLHEDGTFSEFVYGRADL